MPKYYFPNGAPLLFKAAFGVTVANIISWVSGGLWAEASAPRRPNGLWTYPLKFRDGTVYVPHLVGRYLALGLWAHLILMAVCGLMLWRYDSTGRCVRVR